MSFSRGCLIKGTPVTYPPSYTNSLHDIFKKQAEKALYNFQNGPSPQNNISQDSLLNFVPEKKCIPKQKFPCKQCGINFTEKTLSKYNGLCGKCYTKSDGVGDMTKKLKKITLTKKKMQELSIQEHKEPVKKGKKTYKNVITKILRRQTWDTHIGMEIGQIKCPICMISLMDQQSYECGHVKAESKNGITDVVNLRPICSSCNKSMATNDMDLAVYNKNLKKQLK